MDFDWSVIAQALPALLEGARLTVLITLAGLCGGVLVGLLFGLMRAYGSRLVARLAAVYVEFVRARFTDRLSVSIDAPPEVRAALVPTFILQPIVENAIGIGIATFSAP